MGLLTSTSSSSSSLSEEREESNGENNYAPVYLNVYDLTPVNNYLYWVGIGIFHSGIEAHGLEYGYGAHEEPTSGVFEVEPRSCPGFIFRRSLLLGNTNMTRSEFHTFVENLSRNYHGDTYHLTTKNCNHFTDEVCLQLTGKPIPGWVNRMARVGSFCNCLLPETAQLTAIRHLSDQHEYSDDDYDDGSESVSSSLTAESDEEGSNNHLLTIPNNSNIAFVRDKPVKVAPELLRKS